MYKIFEDDELIEDPYDDPYEDEGEPLF